jgi:hypothetical protein
MRTAKIIRNHYFQRRINGNTSEIGTEIQVQILSFSIQIIVTTNSNLTTANLKVVSPPIPPQGGKGFIYGDKDDILDFSNEKHFIYQ